MDEITLTEQIKANRRKFRVDHFDIVISEYINRHEQGKVILDPPYQRTFRWNAETQSELIESIVIGIPLPPIFAFSNSDYEWEIIDGVQRTSTLINFFNGELVLTGCTILDELNNLNYFSLPNQVKQIVKNARLRIELIEDNADSYSQYLLFSRLNNNGEALSSQELRNFLIYKLNPDFYFELDVLKNHPSFKNIISLSSKRQAKQEDTEYVLRFLIIRFLQKSLEERKPNYMKIDELISQEIQIYLENSTDEIIDEDCNLFKLTYDYLDTIFEQKFKITSAVNTSVIAPTLSHYITEIINMDPDVVKQLIENFYNSDEYQKITARSYSPTKRFFELGNFAKEYFNQKL